MQQEWKMRKKEEKENRGVVWEKVKYRIKCPQGNENHSLFLVATDEIN